MLPFLEAVQPELERVNTSIVDNLQSDEPLVEDIGKHLISAGGKRLRPILVILSAHATRYSGSDHIDLAAIIEFIHTATLLHDDVVDVSELRRGLPTANAQWGNAPSVLVGDFLYSRAFQLMVSIGNMDIMRVMSNTTNIIAEGEVQQLANARNPDITESQYLDVIYKKTAALFEAACECGVRLNSDNNQAQHIAMKQYGKHLGLAFQLMDDVLDYEGDSDELGKNVGDDLADGKTTLPVIHTLKLCEDIDRALIRESLQQGSTTRLDRIIDLVKQFGGITYTRDKAVAHVEEAIQALDALPNSSWKESLIAVARFSLERNH
jgi:octaprenyl-diphosphate synthase